MVVVIPGKSILVILFAKGPMKTSMFSSIGRKGKRVFSVLRVFRDDFGICDKRGCPFVAVDHSCLELVGVLELFIFIFIPIFWIIDIESKILFEFEDGVIPHSRVRKVLVPSWFHRVIQHFVDQVNV